LFKKNSTNSKLLILITSYTLIIFVAFIYAILFYKWHLKNDSVLTELYSLKLEVSDLKMKQESFITKKSLDELFYNTGSNVAIKNFESQFKNINTRIIGLSLSNKTNSETGILFKGLKNDFNNLEAKNSLLLKYLQEAGNEQTGLYNHLLITENDLQIKLENTSGNNDVKASFNQIKIFRSVFYLYSDFQILNILNKHINALISELELENRGSNNYYNLRIIDGLHEYKQILNLFARKLMQVGISENEGIRQKLLVNYKRIDSRLNDVIGNVKLKQTDGNVFTVLIIFALVILSVSISFISHLRMAKGIKQFLNQSENYFVFLLKGDGGKVPEKIPNNDFDTLQKQMGLFSDKLAFSSKVINSISKPHTGTLPDSNYKDTIFPEIGDVQKLITRLNKQLKTETNETLVNEWIRKGLSRFSYVLRTNFDDPEQHAKEILSSLVDYLKVPMGAIYLPSTKTINTYDLIASIAFGKKKFHLRSVIKGEGIIGTVAERKKVLNISDIPEDYFKISSGFGEAKPKNIIVIPISMDGRVYGIIELASLEKFKKFELEFIDELRKTLGASFVISSIFLETKQKMERIEKMYLSVKNETKSLRGKIQSFKKKNTALERKIIENNIVNEGINTFGLVAELGMDGNILEINNQFIELLQKTKENIIRTNYLEYFGEIDDDGIGIVEPLWNDIRSGTIRSLEHNFVVSDKSIWLSEVYIPVKNEKGKVYKIKLIAINRTEFKKQESHIDALKLQITNKEKFIVENQTELNRLNEKSKKQLMLINEMKDGETEIIRNLKEKHIQLLAEYTDEQKQKENALYDQIRNLRQELERLKR